MKQRTVQLLAASDPSHTIAIARATTAFEKSAVTFEEAVDTAKSLAGTGSGKVPLLLPRTHVIDRPSD